MDEVLDEEPVRSPNRSYRKWAFRFLVYLVILNLFVAYDVSNGQIIPWRMTLLSILTFLFWIFGAFFTVKSHIRQEDRDYQYYVSVCGFAIFTVINMVGFFIL